MFKLNRSMTSIVNLANSIIGVSILAMPLCFKQCGIILALFIISFSALLNHFSCYLLLKSAIINRRRNYELLAYDVFGSSGKTLVEVCILLFLLGTCVAFFVIVGDIAPSLISHIFQWEQGPQLRAVIMTILAMFVILPLGLMRNVENLTSFSMMSLVVYLFLASRMLSLWFDKFIDDQQPAAAVSANPNAEVNYWNASNMITYLPIFSMALSCQLQLFEIFNSDLFQTKSGSLKSISHSIKKAILICSLVYVVIGLFGYLAFYDGNLSGNILQSLPSGMATKLALLSFLITILTSFPLCLFPSRTSLHSLLFRKGVHNDFLSTSHSIHMSDHHFKLLTVVLIITTMGISIIFPRVELILALVGSTIGAIICFIIPALIYIKICDKNTIEYLLSYLLLFFGTAILIFCTMSALHNISMARDSEIEEKINEFKQRQQKPPIKQQQPSSLVLENQINKIAADQKEMKIRINNINKLKQSLQNDMNKLKKQDEILKRLEKQQEKHHQQEIKMSEELRKKQEFLLIPSKQLNGGDLNQTKLMQSNFSKEILKQPKLVQPQSKTIMRGNNNSVKQVPVLPMTQNDALPSLSNQSALIQPSPPIDRNHPPAQNAQPIQKFILNPSSKQNLANVKNNAVMDQQKQPRLSPPKQSFDSKPNNNDIHPDSLGNKRAMLMVNPFVNNRSLPVIRNRTAAAEISSRLLNQ